MAFVLLHRTESLKGILVIKHSEVPFLNQLACSTIEKLRARYFVGAYVGGYQKIKKDWDSIDFYIADQNVLEVKHSSLPRIYLNGFNFIQSDYFLTSINNHKTFDYIYVGSSLQNKNLLKLLRAIPQALNHEPTLRFLIINKHNSGSKVFRHSTRKVVETIGSFTKKVKNQITYIQYDVKSDLSLPKYSVASLMQSSKSLVILSNYEGAARVVAEAMLCGLNIVSYSKMKGGTNNYLNLAYDLTFDSFEDLPELLASFTSQRKERDDLNEIREKFNESSSKKVLIDRLENFLPLPRETLKSIEKLQLFDAFSGHQQSLDRKIPSNKFTDECLSETSMYRLVTCLLGEKQQEGILRKHMIKDLLRKIKDQSIRAYRKVF